MDGEVETKLYDAATIGDVETFRQLLQQLPHFLHVMPFSSLSNALQIAIMQGHTGIVDEVLNYNPRVARILDCEKSSPLHIAAAEGNLAIAEGLLSLAPEACWWRDGQGMNPVHIAAMKGHVEVLELLLEEGTLPAMERLYRGETVLHLCVKHGQVEALKVLVDKLGELVVASDDDGETLLHRAVRSNQLETIQYLVESKKITRRTRNSMGKTPLQILNRSAANYSEIRRLLLRLSGPPSFQYLPKLTDMTMVVVVLIATMAFQAVVSPPGGVWQDDASSHRAGDAVMAFTHPKIYALFIRANTTAFGSSILIIIYITTGAASESPFLKFVALYATWVALAAITVSYGASTMVITPNTETKSPGFIVVPVVAVALGIYVFSFLFYGLWIWFVSRRNQKPLRQ